MRNWNRDLKLCLGSSVPVTSCIRLAEEPGIEEREGLSPRDLDMDTEGFFLYSASYQAVMKAEKQKNDSLINLLDR